MAENEISDYFEIDINNTDITGITVQENVMKPSNVNNAFRALQGALKRWFKTSLFRLRDSTDQTKLLAFNLANIATATTVTLTVPAASGVVAMAPNLANYLSGLTLSNNVTDAANDIDVAAGVCATSTNVVLMTLATTITKRIDAVWAVGTGNGGLDTGSVAAGTYHVHLIQRSDTGVVDVLFSTSATAPTMPTNYDRRRRIGAVIYVGGANTIRAFKQLGDEFLLGAPLAEYSDTNPGTSAVTKALTVPTGIQVLAIHSFTVADGSPAASTYALVSSLAQADSAPSSTLYSLSILSVGAGANGCVFNIRTDTSAQIRYRLNNSDAGVVAVGTTYGWVDGRGR